MDQQFCHRDPPGVRRQARRAHIQVALDFIGNKLGYKTWIVRKNRTTIHDERRLGEMECVVRELNWESLIAAHTGAFEAALQMDCIWFGNAKLMPAIFEIGDTQSVTSKLMRMQKFRDLLPPCPIRWIIAAADEDRKNVVEEANKDAFRSLYPRFFPYSAVEELRSLCERRHIPRGSVNEPFLDAYMEPCVMLAT